MSLVRVLFRWNWHMHRLLQRLAHAGTWTNYLDWLCAWKINQHKTDAISSVNILYLLLHFTGRLSPFPTFQVEEKICTQDKCRWCTLCKGNRIVRIWKHAGYQLGTRQCWIFKNQPIFKETTAQKSEIIRNMEPEKYSNNVKTIACDVSRLYNGKQTLMHTSIPWRHLRVSTAIAEGTLWRDFRTQN